MGHGFISSFLDFKLQKHNNGIMSAHFRSESNKIYFMLKKFRFIICACSLLLGGTIVLVSLSSAAASQAYTQNSISSRKLYLGKEILPDNLFYPAVALADRAKLEMAMPTERIYLQVNYSHRRLGYAKELLIKGESDLAQSTITKAQKYLNNAAQEALNGDVDKEVKLHLAASIEYHLGELDSMMDSFLPSQKEPLEILRRETLALKEMLSRDFQQP